MQPFAHGVHGDERLELADDSRVTAKGEICFDPILGCATP